MKSIITLLLLLLIQLAVSKKEVMAQGLASAAYVHTTNTCNTSGAYTQLNQADINNNPNAHIQVTPLYPGQNKVIGVEYSGSFWQIVNEDNSAMAINSSFNVVIINDNVSTGTLVSKFVHQVTANTSRSDITNSAANANSTNKLFLTNNRTAGNGGTVTNNKRTQLLWDNSLKRFYLQHDVYQNNTYTPLTLNARYNVLALQSNATNFRSLSATTAINAPDNAIILVQRVQGDEFDTPNLTAPLSVRYDAVAKNWRVYEGAQIASSTRFVNVAIFTPNRAGVIDAAPTPPSKLNAVSNSPSQITFSWGGSSGNEDRYEVQHSLNSNFAPILENTINLDSKTTSQVFQNLTPNTKYFFRVRAIKQSINSCPSGYATAEATTQAPPVVIPNAPTNLSATATSHTQINLSWTDNANNETGFEVERSTDGTNFATLVSLNTDINTYQNTGLNASTRYWYRVRAKNSTGNSAWSNTAEATTQAPPVVIPNAPSNLTATATSSSQINLTWTDNASNETGFEIEKSTDATNFAKLTDLPANASSYSDVGLTASTKYYYRVRAKNSAGNSGYSNMAEATTSMILIMNSPTNLRVISNGVNQLLLSWADNSNVERGFEIWRSADGANYTVIDSVGANGTSYTNRNLRQATTFYYKIRAYFNNSHSDFSNIASARTDIINFVQNTTLKPATLYPNPAQDYLIIQLPYRSEGVMYSIIDLAGKPVLQGENLENIPISIKQLWPGKYIFKVVDNKSIHFLTFIKL